MEQITKHNFVENTDYEITSVRNSTTNRNSKVYQFTLNSANHVLLSSMTDNGKQARQEAINLKQSTQQPQVSTSSVPQTLDEMMMATFSGMQHLLKGKMETDKRLAAQDVILEEQSLLLEDIKDKTVILPNKPQNAESITTVRTRINTKYGLPAWVVNEVLNTFPYAPRPAGQVKNSHEESGNTTYTVWNIAEVNRLFERFVRECTDYSRTKGVHNLLEKPFKLH